MRPRRLADCAGQEHLLGEGKPLRVLIETDQVPSMILWGPPGSGKTTLALIIAESTGALFFRLNAVASGVKEVREVIERAEMQRKRSGRRCILFIDEIHRFNKAQQDALLHSVEEGVLTLIGATTENPSFEVIPPLLSRARVYVLHPLGAEDLRRILERALREDPVLGAQGAELHDTDTLLFYSAGDARMLLNGLETAVGLAPRGPDGKRRAGRKEFEAAFQRKHIRYDDGGEEHYNLVSAFIKSMRGSDPDAALYWLARMLEGGEDPEFIARRMIILASEDVGNADPAALTLAVSCFTAVHTVGMPEGRLVLAQAATYLASAPKSNASYVALQEAQHDVRDGPDASVPLHLRNAPTGLMAREGYGAGYRYSHDFEGGFSGQECLPEELKGRVYYRPTDRGSEKAIRERLLAWWKNRPRQGP
ncbi:MAG: replication-associated recombination protein A [Bacteroidota bacterium]